MTTREWLVGVCAAALAATGCGTSSDAGAANGPDAAAGDVEGDASLAGDSATTADANGAGSAPGHDAGASGGATNDASPGNDAGPAAPPPAAAAGYHTRTFGPAVTKGGNWQPWSSAVNVTQNADGSVTISGGGNSYNSQLETAVPGNGAFTGTAFGGGGYFVATFSIAGGAINMSGGWPAFWANDIEKQAGLGAQWQGQAAGYDDWIEVDTVEFDVSGSTTQYGMGIHNWYGILPNPLDTNTGAVQGFGSPTTTPAGTDLSKPHKYAFVWVPATSTAPGYVEYFFDDAPVPGSKVTWNLYNASDAPPPAVGSSAFSVLDTRHLLLILGTGPNNPITVSSVEVWQASAANDLSR